MVYYEEDVECERIKVEYSGISNVVEAQKYFIIFEDKSHAYIVDKSTLVGGTVDDMRSQLVPILKDQYCLFKY